MSLKMSSNPKIGKVKMNFTGVVDDEATIEIFDVITNDPLEAEFIGGTHYKQVGDQIEEAVKDGAKTIRGLVNSVGGDLYAATAMWHFFYKYADKNPENNHGTQVLVDVIGQAASAATIIPLAADHSRIVQSGSIMIHKPMISPWMITEDDIPNILTILKETTGVIRRIYSEHTGNSEEQINKWMADETTFFDRKAVEHGFINEVIEARKADQPKVTLKEIQGKTRKLNKEQIEETGATVEDAQNLADFLGIDLTING